MSTTFLTFEDLCGLFAAADKYGVPDVAEKASTALEHQLSRDTCVKAAILGHLHQLDRLKRNVRMKLWLIRSIM